MAQKQSQKSHDQGRPAAAGTQTASTPKQGEIYRCGGCGMELTITADCHCPTPDHVKLECCGAEMTRV